VTASDSKRGRSAAFGPGAVTGAIGDSITVVPLVVALALLTDVSLPHALVAFGAFQLVWGIRYSLPVSVEPMKTLAAIAIAGALTYAELALAGHGKASALAVSLVGVATALVVAGVPTPRPPGAPPTPAFAEALMRATLEGVVAQLAMTIGNAALATSLLFADLLDAEVTPDELSTSMGVTNLIAVPLGGVPMCHGCDGVAGKYAFGARTGGANVVLGVGYLVAALFATPALIAAFPLSMLGALLAVVAVSLVRNVTDSGNRALSVGIGLLALATNLGVAFAAGIVVYLPWERIT